MARGLHWRDGPILDADALPTMIKRLRGAGYGFGTSTPERLGCAAGSAGLWSCRRGRNGTVGEERPDGYLGAETLVGRP
jgi:hypothetical protein